jgi:hypothetical protein
LATDGVAAAGISSGRTTTTNQTSPQRDTLNNNRNIKTDTKSKFEL